ncbi:MAG: hypothetical protein LUD27_02355 [Clostridia bacterium]|nr:hypothetical protein [Clostridia bacterium]
MRYHFLKPHTYKSRYGINYRCNHPVYDICTLYKIGEKGLAVIQQRFNASDKSTYWTSVDPWLVDTLYLNVGFKKFFDERAGVSKDGLYPTVTVRQIMWGLKMKPLKRERWETTFDHRDI